MSNDSKKTMLLMGVLLSIFVVVGVSYAFFTYYREGEKQSEIITGQIYMNYIEGALAQPLTNILPEKDEEARADGRTDNVVTFSIEGVNTSEDRDIYYEILLSQGDGVGNKNRLDDEHIKFDLVEITTNEEGVEVTNTVVTGATYQELNNTRIWVNTIPKNTTSKITIKYELRMWISDQVWISDTDNGAHYTAGEYANSFASIRVSVHGDFKAKTIEV